MSQRDTLFQNLSRHSAFKFDEHVVQVFEDMISRSVPGYGLLLQMIGTITCEFSQPHSNYYDLGCSLGASTLAIRHQLDDSTSTIVAVDNSAAMIEQCQLNLNKDAGKVPVELLCEDILSVTIEQAAIVVLNLTLQFIEPEQRLLLLERIYHGLKPGGVLVLSEKVQYADPLQQQKLEQLYYGFKKSQGYSELEISAKRNALENILQPESFQQHQARLQQAGFAEIYPWFQCFNFQSILAIKS